MPAEEAVWASVPYNYSTRTRAEHGDRIVADMRRRLLYPVEPAPYAAQLAAALGHDAHDRLAGIRAQTLVVHGQEDVMVPPANGRLIANLIPHARLLELRDAAHLYPTDEPNADHEIAAFLTASAGGADTS
jgi:pimeloyl-ACP methyl ester carboxylesterase